MPELNQEVKEQKDVVDRYMTYEIDLNEKVMTPLRGLFADWVIRRTHKSMGHDGQNLTDIQVVEPQPVLAIVKKEDAQFVVKERRAIKDPHGYQYGYWHPDLPTPSAILDVAVAIRKHLVDDKDLNDFNDKEK
ncbi:uncharacterized protein L201_004016 [Kwoniella dendrophila CBS 6074]|uniref:Uncharacterized protein n=1 Tax=Kwoniella dendrophila CBS 6074 TaxID=1295534 RepID=A0AAX4JX54_9TREE